MDIDTNNEEDHIFLGFARVALTALSFEQHPSLGHRTTSDRNVDRLVKIFGIEGCHRSEEDNFIKGIVDGDIAERVRQEGSPAITSSATASEHLPLFPHCRVNCLNGLHRILAAKEYLDQNDQWWIVKLYTSALPQEERTVVAEEYKNEQAFSDGEIFRKIRLYHNAGSKAAADRWWVRLSYTKRKDLRQLLKDVRYANAFDALLPWPGLWNTIQLGSLHRLLTMKCDEELLQYLRHIHDAWTYILQPIDATISLDFVDCKTVERLAGLSPTMSSADESTVKDLMCTTDFFRGLLVERDREAIAQRLLSYPSMVPTLSTFFENLKYLEPCAKILRSLLPARHKRTIFESFSASYFSPEELTVEHAANVVWSHLKTTARQDLQYGYQQLWLFVLRNCASMTAFTPRKEPLKPKPSPREPDMVLWQSLGELTWRVGFHLPAAGDLRSQDAHLQCAEQLLSSNNVCAYDQDTLDKLADILRAAPVTAQRSQEAIFTADDNLDTERRHGRPFEDDYWHDQSMLFLPQMYTAAAPVAPCLTTFYCKWAMFRAFFGVSTFALPNALHDQPIAPTHTNATSRPSCAACVSSTADLQASRDRCSYLERELADRAATTTDLQASLEDLRADNTRLENSLSDLHGVSETVAGLNAAHTHSQQRLEGLVNELSQARAETEEATTRATQLEELAHQSSRSEEALQELSAGQERYRQQVRDLTERAIAAEEDAARDQAAARVREQDLRGEIQSLRVSEEASDSLCETLKASLDRSQAMIDSLEQAKDFVATANEALRIEANVMLTKLSQQADTIASLKQTYQDAQAQRSFEDTDRPSTEPAAQDQITSNNFEFDADLHAQTATSYDFDADSPGSAHGPTDILLLNQDSSTRVEGSADFIQTMLDHIDFSRKEYTILMTESSWSSYLVFRVVEADPAGRVMVMDWVLTRAQAEDRAYLIDSKCTSTDFFVGVDHKRLVVGGDTEAQISDSYVFECWCTKQILWAMRKGVATRLSSPDVRWPDLAALQSCGVSIRGNRVSLQRERPVGPTEQVIGKRKRSDRRDRPSKAFVQGHFQALGQRPSEDDASSVEDSIPYQIE